MKTLIIQHVPDDKPRPAGDEPRFCVVRQRDGKRAGEPAAIRSPRGHPVEGRPDSDLLHELQWYLEEFLGYPFHPGTDRADRILDSLKQWGRQTFDGRARGTEGLGPCGGRYLSIAAPDRRR